MNRGDQLFQHTKLAVGDQGDMLSGSWGAPCGLYSTQDSNCTRIGVRIADAPVPAGEVTHANAGSGHIRNRVSEHYNKWHI
jgi:hypothetical protein